MRNLCIIPARGGSKRIPRKNIKLFLGKPIIVYSIESALKTGLFEEVMVSTDDEEIAEIAIQNGAVVPFLRTNQTANDYATLSDVLHEVLREYGILGQYFDNICCLLATCPLIDDKLILEGYEKLLNNADLSTVAPIVAFSYPILRSLQKDEEGESIVIKEIMDINEAHRICEQIIIKKAVEKYGNVTKAAEAVGINPSTIYRKIKSGQLEI